MAILTFFKQVYGHSVVAIVSSLSMQVDLKHKLYHIEKEGFLAKELGRQLDGWLDASSFSHGPARDIIAPKLLK